MQENAESGRKRRVRLGPTGQHVRDNIKRVRERRGLNQSELSRLLAGTEKPLGPSAINEIEHGARRVDTDDLTAIAAALGVNPNALLIPHRMYPDSEYELTGTGSVEGLGLWQWAQGERPLKYRQATGSESSGRNHLEDQLFRQGVWPSIGLGRADRIRVREAWRAGQIDSLRDQVRVTTDRDSRRTLESEIARLEQLEPSDDASWGEQSMDPALPIGRGGPEK